jgi:uncharacterized protein (TIGR03437 family)
MLRLRQRFHPWREGEEMTHQHLLTIAFCAGSLAGSLAAQIPNASLLQIEIQNHRLYVFDADPSKVGKSSTPLDRAVPSTFESWIGIGDIVSVNGNPVKGTVFEKSMTLNARPNATPGQSIADVNGAGLYEWNLELMNPDGTSLGRILVQGLAGGGSSPPGAPSLIPRTDYMVVGGTGVFLGVRGGYFNNNPDPSVPIPVTSAAEDPSLRRVFGGGKATSILYLIPQSAPQVVVTPNGPAVIHSADFTLVSSSKPAAPGEILSLIATGLGPTRPGVEPGKTFPADGSAAVVGPVAVLVNGKPAEVLGAVGYPGAADGYQVNFRLPAGVASGTAAIQVSAAWIVGPEVKIPIQ